jgi:hypothetical protein
MSFYSCILYAKVFDRGVSLSTAIFMHVFGGTDDKLMDNEGFLYCHIPVASSDSLLWVVALIRQVKFLFLK